MIVVSHESHDMYNPIFVLINLFLLFKIRLNSSSILSSSFSITTPHSFFV